MHMGSGILKQTNTQIEIYSYSQTQDGIANTNNKQGTLVCRTVAHKLMPSIVSSHSASPVLPARPLVQDMKNNKLQKLRLQVKLL